MIKPKHQIPILDNLRAIAAWSVCLFHLICAPIDFVNPSGAIYHFFYFGSYGVQLFFVISGLVIPWSLYHSNYSLNNFFKFFIKRLIRLEPPYLISVVIMLTILFFRKYSPTYNNTVVLVSGKQVLLHIGYLIPFFKGVTWLNNIYWTLAIEFQYYIFIGLLYFLFISKKKCLRLTAYIMIFVSPIVFPNVLFLPFNLPVFGIGIFIFLYKTNHIKIVEFVLISLFFLINIFFYNEKTTFVVTLVSELCILLLFNQSNKILSWLGKFSYSIYLMHAIIGITVVNLLSHYTYSLLSKLLVIVAGLTVTFLSSYLMYSLVERPSKKLSSKLAYRTNS